MNYSNKEKSIQQLLTEYSRSGAYPFHMPGHKRNTELFGNIDYPFSIDITEINGFDDLHKPEGILKESMQKASQLFQSERSFYLINGSTCGILAGIHSLVNYGDKIIVARNCHKSVFHAIELMGLLPIYVYPDTDEDFGISGSVLPQSIEKAVAENQDAKLVLITSPTYEGVSSDVEAIAKICHNHKIPLVVDEAHGAHFAFSDFFPKSSLKSGADMVIQSLHKTLPSPTQTAIIHIQGEYVNAQRLSHSLDIFQTSSPSYAMMSAMDYCIRELEKNSEAYFSDYTRRLDNFSQKIRGLKFLKVLCCGSDNIKNHKSIFDFDRGKIVISCKNTSIKASELMAELRDNYSLELEMASTDYVIAMTSIFDTNIGFDRLAKALCEIDSELRFSNEDEKKSEVISFTSPCQIYSPSEALSMASSECDLDNAVGKVSAEYVWAYPPGIPILIPGEKITQKETEQIDMLIKKNVNLVSTSGKAESGKLLVIK